MNDATSELVTVKQQNRQLEPATHALSLELITVATSNTQHGNNSPKEQEEEQTPADASQSLTKAAKLEAASFWGWAVHTPDIILNW